MSFNKKSDLSPPFNLPMGFGYDELQEFLRLCTRLGVSDLTIQSGDYVWGELRRVHTRMTDRRLEHNEVEMLVNFTYAATGVGQLVAGVPIDYEYEMPFERGDFKRVMRFRCNATASRIGGIANGISVTMRTIPGLPMKWEQMNAPLDIHENFFPQYGAVFVLGTTGSGKSTLLAAANRYRLEQHEPTKIITYEEPIEAVYTGLAKGRMPQPSQVQIGSHLKHFSDAGRNAMRRKADVIVMGESRDAESVNACLEMALSGHAVYSTLHADTPSEFFARMVSFFPEDAQPAAANKLLGVTRLVVAQKLTRRTDGSVVALRSWLVVDREVVERLSQVQFFQWGAIVGDIIAKRGTDFESQALPLLINKEIDFERFLEVVRMTIAESIEYLSKHNLEHLIPEKYLARRRALTES